MSPRFHHLVLVVALLRAPIIQQGEARAKDVPYLADEVALLQSQMIKNASCACGILSNKVVGGEDTKVNEFPWLIAVYYNNRFLCGASLINDRFALTAAHCIHKRRTSAMYLLLGAYNLSKVEEGRIKMPIEQAIPHPQYDPDKHENDVGLIEFQHPVRFADNIMPVCLPTKARNYYLDRNATLAGWGRTKEGGQTSSVLQKVELPVISAELCQDYYSSVYISCQRMLCAGPEEGGKSSCQGDSGGPLMLKDEGQTVIAIVSFGIGCARPQRPGVYSRVDSSLDFILKATESAVYCPEPRTTGTAQEPSRKIT